LAELERSRDAEQKALDARIAASARLLRLEKVREKVRSKEWKLVEQGLQELGDERTDSLPGQGTSPSSSVVAPPESPLGGSFFGDPSLSILPNPFSSDTPIPFS
jgi:hypothetical protein